MRQNSNKFIELFLEALKIKKKTSNTLDGNDYGPIGNYTLINTKHTSEKRKDATSSRNASMEVDEIRKTVRDFFNKVRKGQKVEKGKYDIIYNVDGWNKMVVNVTGAKIIIITIINAKRSKPTFKPQDDQIQIIMESENMIIIKHTSS